MSIKKKNKDHLKEHAGVVLAGPAIEPKTSDALCFWTNHPTQNTLVNLRPFSEGEFENPHPNGAGTWVGPFTGRPRLIAEIAPTIEARCSLLTPNTVKGYMRALRAWWRFFDAFENTSIPDGQQIKRVESLAHLNELHEAAAHRRGISPDNFQYFLTCANDARRLLHLRPLLWVSPRSKVSIRTLIPEDQARDLKTAIKQDWERVRLNWEQNDAIRAEAEKRSAGEPANYLGEEQENLLNNWQCFQRIQEKTGLILPASKHLRGKWKTIQSLHDHGFSISAMRAILFPTNKEADIAYHLALMNSGWNPSTLSKLDATSPFLVTDHPKDNKQLVLSFSRDEEATIQAEKPRARGKTQFCTGLKKHSSSPPMIVSAYLKRVEPLREILRRDYQVANDELARMQAAGEKSKTIQKQIKHVQKIGQGCSSVWLYLSYSNQIKWIDGMQLPRYTCKEKSKPITYLGLVLERLNAKRDREGKVAIPCMIPSDFRDIYARWVYRQTGGNILAVMLALGHSSLRSTGCYLDNNIFSAENDQQARSFMNHLFAELERGRIDLTILAQLVRHGSLTPEMEDRLAEYRKLMRSRYGVGCADPRHPPAHVAPVHVEGRLCGTQRCLKECPHARFLPESLDGIAKRVEELLAMSDYLPRETWLRGGFQVELDEGEKLLETLYSPEGAIEARNKWRLRISIGKHVIPGIGRIGSIEESV